MKTQLVTVLKNFLKEQVLLNGAVDVTSAKTFFVSKIILIEALADLEKNGYDVYQIAMKKENVEMQITLLCKEDKPCKKMDAIWNGVLKW
ncbi:MAG: hypothetical protein R3Y53_01970 [Bacillota bacterium]